MKSYVKMFIGMLIGILSALTLTLNVWGDEFYKLIVSALLGIVIGVFVTDAKTSTRIFVAMLVAIRSFWKSLSLTTDQKTKERRKLRFFKSFATIAVCFTLVLAASFVSFWLIGFSFNNIDQGKINYCAFLGMIILVVFILDITAALDFNEHRKFIPDAFRKVWGDKAPKKFYRAIISLSYWQVFSRSSKLFVIHLSTALYKQFIWFFRVAIPTIAALLVMILLIVPWFIKEIGKYGHLTTVALAIATGAFVGIVTHAWLYGLLVIPVFLSFKYLVGRWQISPWWVFKNTKFFPTFPVYWTTPQASN